MEMLMVFVQALVYLLISVALLWSMKSLFLFYEKWIDREEHIAVVDNLPEAVRRAGLFLGAAIALSAPLINGSQGSFLEDVAVTLLDAAAIVVLMLVTTILNDKVYIAHLDNGDAVSDGNATVAFIEAGAYIATGLVLFGSFVGSGPWISSIVFFALTQLLLLAIIKLYDFQAPFDLKQAILDNNLAAGIVLSGIFVSYGIILSAAVRGDFTDWIRDLNEFALTVLMAVVLIAFVFNSIVDRIFLPAISLHRAVDERNVPAAVITASIKVSLAVIIAQVMV
jgi:uncharacterized membrane protein YjfL (UPF0719 family)